MGIGPTDTLSPGALKKVVYAGATARGFAQAAQDLLHEAELTITSERVRRATEGIGAQRVAQRQKCVEDWLALPLPARRQSPHEHVPQVAVVSTDGGRMQVLDDAPEPDAGDPRRRFWREVKAACFLRFSSEVREHDPCPELPQTFANLARVAELARGIKGFTPVRRESEPAGPAPREETEQTRPGRPELLTRHVLAMRTDVETFAAHAAAAAWEGGFSAAARKAFVADGLPWNWTVWRKYFSDYTPILDFVHALCYVFQAASAGRPLDEVAEVYRGWAQLLWSGRGAELIAAIEARQRELGEPQPADGDLHPRSIVAGTVQYLRNQGGRMNYPEYRRQGLPITSAHIESTIKQLNRRVKGTEKFWRPEEGNAILQLASDYLSDRTPMDHFWKTRPAAATGFRPHD